MAFRRLSIPSYFGGLPAGYGYLNNALGAPTTQSPADGAKVGGPHAGSYFHSWTDDATSVNFNRPIKALAENTDILDNLFHRDVAVMKVTADAVAPGGGVASVGVADALGVYVGVAGTPNTAAGLNTCFEITDEENHEIVNPNTGAKCRVTAIAGAVVGTNFAAAGATVTLTISPAIPAGKTYRIYYATRANLAMVTEDELSKLSVRTAHEMPARAVDFINQVSRRTGQEVEALVAPIFETPSGVRRPRSPSMTFDVDPDAVEGGVREFLFRQQRDASPDTIARILRYAAADPADLVRRMELGASGLNGYGSGGTLAFWDAQTISGGTAGSLVRHIPFSGGAANGDDYMRVNDRRTARSVLRSLNARTYVSVGNGTTTFGDFNGTTAIADAIAAISTATQLHIHVKAGTYELAATQAITSGKTVIIEGVDRSVSIVEGNAFGGQTFSITAGGRLILKNITLRKKAGGTDGGIEVGGSGYLYIFDCDVIQQRLQFSNTNPQALGASGYVPPLTQKPTLTVRDSFLDMDGVTDATGAFANIRVIVGDNLEHVGYFVRDCIIRCTDHNAPLKIEASSSGISDTRVRDVIFQNCKILLASTTDNAGFLSANCGVCWLEPLNSEKMLNVDNLVWKDCDVWANHKGTGATSVLMHLIPPSIRFNTTTETGKCHIGRVTVDGGDWRLPDANTAHISWALNAQTLRVRNLYLRHTSGTTGVVTKDMSWYYNASGTPTPSKYASFSFLGKIESSSPFHSTSLFDVEGVYLRNIQQSMALTAGGMGDLLFSPSSPSAGSVRHVRVYGGGSATGANPPGYRIILETQGGVDCTVDFEDVVFDGRGTPGVLNVFKPWANNGVIAVSAGLGATFTRVGVYHPDGQSAISYLRALGTGGVMNDCFAKTGEGSGNIGLLLEGGTTWTVNGGQFIGCGTYGIVYTGAASARFHIQINDVHVENCANYGLWVQAAETQWAPGGVGSPSSSFSVTGSRFLYNNGGAYIQARLDNTTAASTYGLYGLWIGNTLLHTQGDVGAAELQVTKNGAAFGTEALNMRGLDDGFTGTFAAGLRSNRFNYQLTRNGP